ncbi:MAG: Legume lectin beta domain protein, partial [Pedosphaera sp.]|nr:Legume lectin beta domain protein [Pedosphaera sp.]
DTSTSPPESNTNWVAVPAALISGNGFDYAVDGPVGVPVNTPVAFDLSHLPAKQRVGYGWAVGGVPANGAAHFISSTELRAFGVPASSFTNVAGAPQILLDLQPLALTYPSGLPLPLTVYVAGTQPISYRWKFNGTNLTDNGRISGSQSSALTIAEVFAGDAGTYQLFMTNGVGNNASALMTLAVTRPALNNGGGWTLNGGAVIASNVLTLTDGAANEARSSFLNYPEYIGAFKATWTYQDVGGGGADGAAFVLQNDSRGASALGGGGGGLGYNGITPSAALEFNIYGPNVPGIALRNNGATGAPYSPTTPINLAGGDPIGVALNYDGATLSLTLTDTVTHVSFSTNYLVDLPSIVGTNAAYVGITGGTGGAASTQKISNFSFVSLPNLTVQPTGSGTFVFTWPGAAGGFVLQQNSDLGTTNWSSVTNAITLVNGQNQVTVPAVAGSRFYRLTLP